MMNVLQVQDDLKNFSEDQLIKEMQQPSGNAPQFLVLSELNRRKRVKGDFEARQAQQQPTVAEEVVASAGVPQTGMMGMSEAMAPQSAVSDGVGTNAPMKMASGGLAQFGNDIRQSMSQEIDPYLDGVQQEAEQKFNIDLDQDQPKNIMQLPGPRIPTFGMRPRVRPSIEQVGIGGKGIARPAVIPDMRARVPFEEVRSIPYSTQLRGYAEGGVIKAANGFQYPISKQNVKDKNKQLSFLGDPEKPNDDVENVSEDVTTDTTTKSATNASNYSILPMLGTLGTDTVEQDIINLQKGLQKERALDKNLALAQAGLGILASDAPTLGQAIGEGGTKGLEAFRDANKRYQEGVVDLINARAKIAAGRKKGKLTASDIMSNLNKTREQLYGKVGDMAYIQPNLDPEVKNRLEAQEAYLIQLLQDYGVNLPVAKAT